MPRVNVWIPDELQATVRAQLPDLNISKALRDALAGLLECNHDALTCARCATPVDHHQLTTAALGRFYADLLWDLHPLVTRLGTAEGAARVAREVGQRHQIPEATRIPLPRPTRGERLATTVTDLPLEAASRERHPTALQPTTATPETPTLKAGAA